MLSLGILSWATVLKFVGISTLLKFYYLSFDKTSYGSVGVILEASLASLKFEKINMGLKLWPYRYLCGTPFRI